MPKTLSFYIQLISSLLNFVPFNFTFGMLTYGIKVCMYVRALCNICMYICVYRLQQLSGDFFLAPSQFYILKLGLRLNSELTTSG